PVHAGAPDPPGRVELQLPAVRREPEHGGGDRAGAAAGGGGQHRVPRAGAGVAGGGAGCSRGALGSRRPPSYLYLASLQLLVSRNLLGAGSFSQMVRPALRGVVWKLVVRSAKCRGSAAC